MMLTTVCELAQWYIAIRDLILYKGVMEPYLALAAAFGHGDCHQLPQGRPGRRSRDLRKAVRRRLRAQSKIWATGGGIWHWNRSISTTATRRSRQFATRQQWLALFGHTPTTASPQLADSVRCGAASSDSASRRKDHGSYVRAGRLLRHRHHRNLVPGTYPPEWTPELDHSQAYRR